MAVINWLAPIFQLAKILFDSPEAIVCIDASKYSEKHSVARLVSCMDLITILPLRLLFFLHQIGSPPSYVGYVFQIRRVVGRERIGPAT
jgi:hypothetical protein